MQESSKPANFFFGTVISEKPLKISVEQKLVLSEKQLILTRNTSDYKTEFSFNNPDIEQKIKITNLSSSGNISFNSSIQKTNISQKDAQISCNISNLSPIKHSITIYNSLKKGEKVILARFCGGEKYLIMDRTVEYAS